MQEQEGCIIAHYALGLVEFGITIVLVECGGRKVLQFKPQFCGVLACESWIEDKSKQARRCFGTTEGKKKVLTELANMLQKLERPISTNG